MSDSTTGRVLDAAMVQRIAAIQGITLEVAECEGIAQQMDPQLRRLRHLADTLWADDDLLAFRRTLEHEGSA